MWAIFRAVRRMASGYDGILSNHSLTVLPSVLGANARKKVVYYIQAYEPEYYGALPGIKNKVYEAISRQSYGMGLKQIVNAPIYLSYKEIEADACVPPGFDPAHFYPAVTRSSPQGRITLGCIGRHEPHKGTRDVLEAFEHLYKQDERYWLKVAYGNLPVGWTHPNVEVVIPSGDAELGDFYRSVDVYLAAGKVQPGAYHYPVMEALACGTPVIHTGYSPGTVENSWIIPQGGPVQFAEAIQAIDWNVARSKSMRGLGDVAPLSWPHVTHAFNRHLEDMLASR